MRYWDTSALLKLYVEEQDSDYFAALVKSLLSVRATELVTTDKRMRDAALKLEFKLLPD